MEPFLELTEISKKFYSPLSFKGLLQLKIREENRTVIFTTHRMDETLDFTHTVMFLNNGRLSGIGTTEELRQKTGLAQANLGELFLMLTRP